MVDIRLFCKLKLRGYTNRDGVSNPLFFFTETKILYQHFGKVSWRKGWDSTHGTSYLPGTTVFGTVQFQPLPCTPSVSYTIFIAAICWTTQPNNANLLIGCKSLGNVYTWFAHDPGWSVGLAGQRPQVRRESLSGVPNF